MRHIQALAVCLFWGAVAGAQPAEKHPLDAKERGGLREQFTKSVTELSKALKASPKKVSLYSRRGDAYFFLGDFEHALADYEKMVELNADTAASHWRRGIAYFYAGKFKPAAKQFELYHSFDDIDRENGIWRFFSQAKAYGLAEARKRLLKYKQTDREPFAAVYKLFDETIEPDAIIAQIGKAKIGEAERAKRLFYAHLYIGLDHAVRGRDKQALPHLRKATASKWPRTAGFGPNYMWHVGRLHFELLSAVKK